MTATAAAAATASRDAAAAERESSNHLYEEKQRGEASDAELASSAAGFGSNIFALMTSAGRDRKE